MPLDERNLRGLELKKHKAYEGLTPNQWRYCQERAAGANQTDAHLAAYPNQNAARSTTAGNAAVLEGDRRIATKIKEMIAEKNPQTTLAPTITREFVTQGIAEIATNPKAKDTTRLRAYELLGKIAGVDLFREIKVTETHTKSVADVDSELRAYLSKLAPILDGTARAVNDADRIEPATINPNPVNSVALSSMPAPTPAQSDDALALGPEPKRDRRRKPGAK